MIDAGKMNKTDFENGEFCPVCRTLNDAAEILHTADRIPDETTKAPLIEGAKKMIRNVLDALDGRRTDGLVMEDDD
jgi:hypothetical protein